jgi:hypothetical protein
VDGCKPLVLGGTPLTARSGNKTAQMSAFAIRSQVQKEDTAARRKEGEAKQLVEGAEDEDEDQGEDELNENELSMFDPSVVRPGRFVLVRLTFQGLTIKNLQ